MTRVLTSADFASTIASGVTLVDMYADWCGPCQAIAPTIEDLSHEYEGRANICKVDVDASPEISNKYGVMGIPTLLVFKDGQLVTKKVGLSDREEIVTMLDAQLA